MEPSAAMGGATRIGSINGSIWVSVSWHMLVGEKRELMIPKKKARADEIHLVAIPPAPYPG